MSQVSIEQTERRPGRKPRGHALVQTLLSDPDSSRDHGQNDNESGTATDGTLLSRLSPFHCRGSSVSQIWALLCSSRATPFSGPSNIAARCPITIASTASPSHNSGVIWVAECPITISPHRFRRIPESCFPSILSFSSQLCSLSSSSFQHVQRTPHHAICSISWLHVHAISSIYCCRDYQLSPARHAAASPATSSRGSSDV